MGSKFAMLDRPIAPVLSCSLRHEQCSKAALPSRAVENPGKFTFADRISIWSYGHRTPVLQPQGNRIKIEPIPPNRGLILDRNGVPLATNAPSYQFEMTRELVSNVDETLTALRTIIHPPAQAIQRSRLPHRIDTRIFGCIRGSPRRGERWHA